MPALLGPKQESINHKNLKLSIYAWAGTAKRLVCPRMNIIKTLWACRWVVGREVLLFISSRTQITMENLILCGGNPINND